MSLRSVLSLVVALVLIAGGCAGTDFDESLSTTTADVEAAETDADETVEPAVEAIAIGDSDDGSADDSATGTTPAPSKTPDDCSRRPFDDADLFGDRWCWGDYAFGLVDVLGADGVGYQSVRAIWTRQRGVSAPAGVELGHLLDAGLDLESAENICAQMVADGAADEERCVVLANPGSAALASVRTALAGGDVASFGPAEAITELTALVEPNDEASATFNRDVSFAAGGSADGCWLVGDVTLACAVDLRGEDQLVTETIVVIMSPQGVTGPDFEGFTGEWEIFGAELAGESPEFAASPTSRTLSIYGLSGFEPPQTLGEVVAVYGGQIDSSEASPVQGACFLAAGRGFPDLQFIVEGADSGDPADGIVRGYVSLSPDIGTPSGMRPGSQRFDVTDALGLQLERVIGSGLIGYWLDFRAEDPAEQDVTVRFHIGNDDKVAMVAAGERAWVGNPDCGHLE